LNIQQPFPINGFGKGRYLVDFAFVGVHFETEDDIKFYQLYGSYTDLDAWVNKSGFKIETEIIAEKMISKIFYEKPSPIFSDVNDNLEVGIGFSSHGPNQSRVQTEVSISQVAYLVIRSKSNDIYFDTMFSKLNIFCYLFQFGIQRIPYPISIIGTSHKNEIEQEGKKPYFPEIKIYFKPIEPIINRKILIPQEMLFTFNDLKSEQIKTWFNSFEKYQSIIHLYRSIYYKYRLFIETRFLNITQALEILHSLFFDNQYLSGDIFSNNKNRVLESAPVDLRDWLSSALSSANYKRFKLKIFEIVSYKSELFSDCFTDIDLFSKNVRDTRNNFIHHNNNPKAFQTKEELSSAIYLMKMIIESYLLEIIGFTPEKVRELLTPRINTYLTGWLHLRSEDSSDNYD
jgi:hypothetical protein